MFSFAFVIVVGVDEMVLLRSAWCFLFQMHWWREREDKCRGLHTKLGSREIV